MDFMSYANYIRANRSSTAHIDADTLREHSQQTFQTFSAQWIDGQNIAYDELTGEEEQRPISEPIEMLAMTQTATWPCLGILFVLMLILVILIVSVKIAYPRTDLQQDQMPSRCDCHGRRE
jgi:hypothetical protein